MSGIDVEGRERLTTLMLAITPIDLVHDVRCFRFVFLQLEGDADRHLNQGVVIGVTFVESQTNSGLAPPSDPAFEL